MKNLLNQDEVFIARLDAELCRRDIRSELKYDGVWKLYVYHTDKVLHPFMMVGVGKVRYSPTPSPHEFLTEFDLSDIGEVDILGDFIVDKRMVVENNMENLLMERQHGNR